ncbi:MAG: glycoside hydrolase family 2 protein [Ruminococcus sp.]|nr:glycoside hydrolase family 2 protein [Ruminococcus sp.]
MSSKYIWNNNWKFTKDAVKILAGGSVLDQGSWEEITLPHTWNGIDGQDGGNDYHRGTCYYTKKLKSCELVEGKEVYIQFDGANSSADLYVNGTKAGHHDGGYSTWRVNITSYLYKENKVINEDNEIVVAVDNASNEEVYPQMADFTFYGGLYREVSLICADKVRFDLDYLGGPAIAVTPEVVGTDAKIKAEIWLTGATGQEKVRYTIFDGEKIAAQAETFSDVTSVEMEIKNVHLWNGRKDPHLYQLKAELIIGGEVLDERLVKFGCRTFKIDPQKGFFLNGESYPLHGVSRHQDRPGIGNALLKEHHRDDMELICEMGANTIRLAHYQHDQYFYDLCDEKGMIIWAEIPYISRHMPTGRENTISQMKELIVQNYNHPSIVVWGLSNEITMNGSDKDLLENHKVLNDLVHKMDKTRLTTMAVVSMCSMDDPYIQIPDVISYNHYFGWYGGTLDMNGKFMDEFHEKYPNIPIGMSEYGCEALNWHTSNPEQGDYTEEYQAVYHEELIKQLFTRPYIWSTHVWNMFDFAADARAEGGEAGMNHKGLMTFDRKYKKDSFYAYKAWLSDEPFVHICGKRYVDRVEDVTKVTVYSNQPEVELLVDGKSLGKKTSKDHFFYYNVPNAGESTLTAKAGACQDESHIRKVETFNEDYRMKEEGDVLNWFEITMPEGRFSINDNIGDIMATFRGKLFVISMAKMLMKNVKKDKDGKNKKKGGGINLNNQGIMKMVSGFTVKRALSMMGTAGLEPLTKEQMLEINRRLNKIKKKK